MIMDGWIPSLFSTTHSAESLPQGRLWGEFENSRGSEGGMGGGGARE
jgi:hypothetical protein